MSQRDYTSFTSAAKPRFKHVAFELGYEQLSGVLYAKQCEGRFEVFSLQAAAHGNDFFYVNFGIAVPNLCPASEPLDIRSTGLILSERLRDVDDTGGFGSENKQAIADSADRVLLQLKRHALPWFEQRNTWLAIASDYYASNPIEEDLIGKHSTVFGADFRSANYAYLMLKAGKTADALRWLNEARRLLKLPVYHTRDGRTIHEPEKFARLKKPEAHELEWLREVETTLELATSER